MSNIPILGRGPAPEASAISPQARLNIADRVGEILAETRKLGLRHGRLVLLTGVERTSAEFMIYLDSLGDAGCVVIAVNEHPAQNGNAEPCLQVHVLFRLPRENAS